jgi:hypothetical protein
MKNGTPTPPVKPPGKQAPRRKRANHLPQEFQFFIGGYMGSSHVVELVAGELRYRRAEHAYKFSAETTHSPSREQWDEFWRALDAIGVWHWAPTYVAAGIVDGTHWNLGLSHAGHVLRSGGSNAYPGDAGCSPASAFGQFLAALRTLTGWSQIA